MTTPFVSSDMLEYLEANGFTIVFQEHAKAVLSNREIQLVFFNDMLTIARWQEGSDDEGKGYRKEQTVNHISAMEDLQWWFLLDAYGVVRIKDFVKRASFGKKHTVITQISMSFLC